MIAEIIWRVLEVGGFIWIVAMQGRILEHSRNNARTIDALVKAWNFIKPQEPDAATERSGQDG